MLIDDIEIAAVTRGGLINVSAEDLAKLIEWHSTGYVSLVQLNPPVDGYSNLVVLSEPAWDAAWRRRHERCLDVVLDDVANKVKWATMRLAPVKQPTGPNSDVERMNEIVFDLLGEMPSSADAERVES